MSETDSPAPLVAPTGMTVQTAGRVENSIIGLGIFALVLIFQPFSLALFGVGCALVVLAGLINNLLPVSQPGVPARAVASSALIVALIFCIVMLLSITAAHLYGVLFVPSPAPEGSLPFYDQPFVWGVAGVTAGIAITIAGLNRRGRTPQ